MLESITSIYHTIMVSKYAVKGLEWVKDKIGDYVADYANTLTPNDITNSFSKMAANTNYDIEGNREAVDNMSSQLSTFTQNLADYYNQNPDVDPNLGQFMTNCNQAINENPDVYSSYFLSKGVDPEKIQAFNQKCAEGSVDFSDVKSVALATFGSYSTVSGISKDTQTEAAISDTGRTEKESTENQTEVPEQTTTAETTTTETSEADANDALTAKRVALAATTLGLTTLAASRQASNAQNKREAEANLQLHIQQQQDNSLDNQGLG